MTTITISPVTRIEGHAKISLHSDAEGRVKNASFHVTSFRGFEQFLKGAAIERLPTLTSRICGICPIAHQLASVKAIENAYGATVPPPAVKLRELLLMGQFLASHIVSLGVLSLPDLLLPDAKPEERNLIGLMQANNELAQAAMALRKLGMDIFNAVGRRELHVTSCVIGGISKPLAEEERQDLLKELEAAEPHLRLLMDAIRSLFETGQDVGFLGTIPSPHFGLTQDGRLSFYDGQLKLVDEEGQKIALLNMDQYFDLIEERIFAGSYMKFPILKDGRWFRVGPLARLNVNEQIDTPWAQEEFNTYRQVCGHPVHDTLLFHYARMIETIYAWERAQELLQSPDIVSPDVWIPVTPKDSSGIGIIEAPRGTLVHHYELDKDGYAKHINLIVATVHNNYAINMTINEIAAATIQGIVEEQVPEPTLNRLEMIVRAYDPCLSCATH